MPLVKGERIRFATDESMATITRTAGTAFRGALYDLLDAVLSGNPSVVEAAEQAARNAIEAELAARDIAIHGQRGIEIESSLDGLVEAKTFEDDGTLISGVEEDGTNLLPRARVQEPIKTTRGGEFGVTDLDGMLTAFTHEDGEAYFWFDENGRPHNKYLDAMFDGGADGGPILVLGDAGQSSAAESVPPWADMALSSERVLTWRNGTAVALDPSRGYLGSGFAREVAFRNPGCRVLLVPEPVGNTGFSTSSIEPPPSGYNYAPGGTWDWTLTEDPNNLPRRFTDKLIAAEAWALAQHEDSRLVGVAWSQGQNDRTRAGTYPALFDGLVAYIRDRTGHPDLPIVVAGLIEEWAADPTQGAAEIMKAIRDAPRRLDFVSYVPAPIGSGDQVQNHIHATAPWAEEHGRRLVDGLMRAIQATPTAPPVLPGPPRIVRSGTEAIISWDPPATRVTAYELDYSTNSGSSWTAATITEPVRTDVTLTGITATSPLWVRMRVTTPSGTSENTLITKG